MKEYTLIIAAIDTRLSEELNVSIRNSTNLKVVGTTTDGLQALHMINTLHPDMILMDIFLPGLDGLCLLKEMNQMHSRPIAICMLDSMCPVKVEMISKNGAGYLICKPAATASIISVLNEYALCLSIEEDHRQLQHSIDSESSISIDVHHILHTLGFSFKLTGSEYLAESIIIASQTPTMIRNLSRELYCEVARRRDTTPACVERSIRTAIAAANVSDRLTSLLGSTPTNKSCIRYVLNRIISAEASAEVL